MQITPTHLTFAYAAPSDVQQTTASQASRSVDLECLPPSRCIDFSRVTPRQLQEYLDEMIFSKQIDPDDATALSTSLPSGISELAPDTPIDLTAQIQGMIEFDRNNGFDLLATFYSGLLSRMKLMEDRSVHISVKA